MIHQLLNEAQGKIDQVILNTDQIDLINKKLDQAKIPALVINNHLPLNDHIEREKIATLRDKGVEYYPAGRTGMPAMVTAEDGLAVPGSLIATTDKNLLELAVLGSYVLYLDDNAMLDLLDKGTVKIKTPEVMNIVLKGNVGEWTGGIDIALYLEKYFDCPKDVLLEIHGEGLNSLPLNERFNLARTLIGLGYEKLLFQVDEAVMAFLQDRTEGEGRFYFAETDAEKEQVINIELQKIHPMIAWNEKDEIKIGPLTDKDGTNIDHIFIGGDTACRFADIQEGLKLIRYRPLADAVNGSILPGSQLVYGDLLDMGIAGILTEIGFDILPSSFLELIEKTPEGKQIRLGTSLKLLPSGAMVANALSCFSAAMTGRITHPLELESIIKSEDHQHEHGSE
jgi:3-isopropylmalate/(R)-2-methylmalate dehydratase large subunit